MCRWSAIRVRLRNDQRGVAADPLNCPEGRTRAGARVGAGNARIIHITGTLNWPDALVVDHWLRHTASCDLAVTIPYSKPGRWWVIAYPTRGRL